MFLCGITSTLNDKENKDKFNKLDSKTTGAAAMVKALEEKYGCNISPSFWNEAQKAVDLKKLDANDIEKIIMLSVNDDLDDNDVKKYLEKKQSQKNTIKKGLEKKYKLQPSDLFFSQLGKKDEK